MGISLNTPILSGTTPWIAIATAWHDINTYEPQGNYLSNQSHQLGRLCSSTTLIRVVTRHQYEISALAPQTSFCGETIGGIMRCQLFSQATNQTTKNGPMLGLLYLYNSCGHTTYFLPR